MAADTDATLPAALGRDEDDPEMASILSAYTVSATLWLVFATAVAVVLSIKFVYPDFATSIWLDFGRLRPIHTNDVFYAWASPGMVGLALYIAARSSGTRLFSAALAWIALALFNVAAIAGTIALELGFNDFANYYLEWLW
ncbi:MAG: cbb3-type cytochrome c oxidase subunit I, partial [Acetobacteraceae bacterium]